LCWRLFPLQQNQYTLHGTTTHTLRILTSFLHQCMDLCKGSTVYLDLNKQSFTLFGLNNFLLSGSSLFFFALGFRLIFNVTNEVFPEHGVLLHYSLVFFEQLESTQISVVKKLPNLVILADITAQSTFDWFLNIYNSIAICNFSELYDQFPIAEQVILQLPHKILIFGLSILPGLPDSCLLLDLAVLLSRLKQFEGNISNPIGLHIFFDIPTEFDDFVFVFLILSLDDSADLEGLMIVAVDKVLHSVDIPLLHVDPSLPGTLRVVMEIAAILGALDTGPGPGSLAHLTHNLKPLLVDGLDPLDVDQAVPLLEVNFGCPDSASIVDPDEVAVGQVLNR
jgi:hypothetical protein